MGQFRTGREKCLFYNFVILYFLLGSTVVWSMGLGCTDQLLYFLVSLYDFKILYFLYVWIDTWQSYDQSDCNTVISRWCLNTAHCHYICHPKWPEQCTLKNCGQKQSNKGEKICFLFSCRATFICAFCWKHCTVCVWRFHWTINNKPYLVFIPQP